MSVRYGFSGQVAVITGAANGFGRAVATRLAAEVANVVTWLLSTESEYVSGALHLIDGALNS